MVGCRGTRLVIAGATVRRAGALRSDPPVGRLGRMSAERTAVHNRFYDAFDVECYGDRKPRADDYRTPFQIDRDRIVHTSAFRRLQGKTQVFWSGEYDFYRTRLTHSLEVAQIGKSICNWLLATSDELGDDFRIDTDLIEAVCLAHDLGHPPFGHAGERVLNELLCEYGGFEGNAQTLRSMTRTIYRTRDGRGGMSPTRGFADGVLKYKSLRREFAAVGDPRPANHFLYDDQSEVRDFVLGCSGPPDGITKPAAINALKSVECQVMDWADDTAYSLNDLADGIHAEFLTSTKIERWAESESLNSDEAAWIDAWLDVIRDGRVESYTGYKISCFLRATSLERRDGPLSKLSSRHRYSLVVASEIMAERELYGRLARDLVYEAPQVHQLELKARHVLSRVFDVLAETYVDPPSGARRLHLLPPSVEALIASEDTPSARARRVCDYIAGMTDGFASRTYKRLFDPDFGSIVDLV